MSKIELPTVTSGYNLSAINDNFQKIEDTLNKEVLYRKEYLGEPNEMQTNLDMNGKQILNVATGTSDGSLVTKGYVDQGLALKFDKSGGPISGAVDMGSNEILNVSRLSATTLEIGGVQVVPTDLVIDHYNEVREALRRSYAEAGLNVKGYTKDGVTLTSTSDVVIHSVSGKGYSWNGVYPEGGYVVTPETDPTLPGSGYVPRTDVTLRSELADGNGDLISIENTPDTAGSTFKTTLDIHIKSYPIDLRRALPPGYVTDGSIDYSSYVQKVYDYLYEYGGGKVIVPSGMSILIGNIDIKSGNIETIGNDWTSVIKVKPSSFGFTLNRLSGGTTSVNDNSRNILFSGFKVLGDVASSGFSEHLHLFHMNAVSFIEFNNMNISGFRGDGIYIGSSGNPGVERHNENLLINKCLFDGVNKENRNAVSIIDASGVTISNSRFINSSRNDMPGAIDIEPNANSFHIVERVSIVDNDFENIGGFAAVACTIPGVVAHKPLNINIMRNNIKSCNSPLLYNGGSDPGISGKLSKFNFSENTIESCSVLYDVRGAYGGSLSSNVFTNCTIGSSLGFPGFARNKLIKSNSNVYKNCATTSTTIAVYNSDDVEFCDEKFIDCGPTLIQLAAGGSTSGIKVDGLYARHSLGVTNKAVYLNPGHTTLKQTNRLLGLDVGTIPVDAIAYQSDVHSTYTPIIEGTTSAGVGTYSSNSGIFYISGKSVKFYANIVCTSHTGTGGIEVSLPPITPKDFGYAKVNGSVSVSGVAITGNTIHCSLNASASADGNQGVIRLYQNNSSSSPTLLTIPAGAFTVSIEGEYISA